ISGIGWDFLGDLSKYDGVDAIKDAIQDHRGGDAKPTHAGWACYQFANEMQVGDVVFAKRGTKHIIGYGVVSSDYRYDSSRERYRHVRAVDWKLRGEWVPQGHSLVTKTLTEIGKYPKLVQGIRRALQIEPVIESDAE